MTRVSHKVFLLLIKWIPVVMAAGILLVNTLYLIGVDYGISYITNVLLGNSVSYIIVMYSASHVFKFCIWHRLVIIYDALMLLFNVLMKHIPIEFIDNIILLFIQVLISMIFIRIIYNKIKKLKNHDTIYIGIERSSQGFVR